MFCKGGETAQDYCRRVTVLGLTGALSLPLLHAGSWPFGDAMCPGALSQPRAGHMDAPPTAIFAFNISIAAVRRIR